MLFLLTNKLLFLITFLLFLGTFASAQGITYLGVDTHIFEGYSHSEITITLDYHNYTEFRIPLFYNIHRLEYSANFENVKCNLQKKSYGTDIVCDVFPTKEKRQLNLEFDSFDTVKRSDNVSLFKQDFNIPLNTKTIFLKTTLPEGMVLIEKSTLFQPYLPVDGEKGSDGRRIFVTWRRENLKLGENFNIQIAYESTTDNYSQLITFFTGSLIGLIIIILLMGGGIWYFIKKRKGIQILLPVLKKDEKIIIETLMKYKGKTNQRILVNESNYSKAKVSKVLKSLEERGLIKLERIGRTNKVYLIENYEKQEKSEK